MGSKCRALVPRHSTSKLQASRERREAGPAWEATVVEKGLNRTTAPARAARPRPVPTRVPLAGWLSMTPNPVVFALPSSPAFATFVSAAPPPLPPLGCAGTFLSCLCSLCFRFRCLRCLSRYLDRISQALCSSCLETSFLRLGSALTTCAIPRHGYGSGWSLTGGRCGTFSTQCSLGSDVMRLLRLEWLVAVGGCVYV